MYEVITLRLINPISHRPKRTKFENTIFRNFVPKTPPKKYSFRFFNLYFKT
jgi:hypothetical protein